MKNTPVTTFLMLAATTLALRALPATEFHVAITGSDANPGTQAAPLRTIQHAADLAQPGDTVTVHAGVYREYVNPPRGGESDTKRIVYQAGTGEKVLITGSEEVKNWENVQDGVWKATLPNTFFGTFNPFAEVISGDWFHANNRTHHAGAVYLNGHWLTEAVSLEEVLKPMTETPLWFASVDATNTVIWAQFKSVDPNAQQVEVNARQSVFYPDKPGRNFITVRGFTLRNAATPWAPPTAEQVGLIGTHWSKGWIIENNVVGYSICSGISLGKYGDEWDNKSANSAEGYVKTIERATAHGWNKETIGHHVVRNNIISHCEQAGIVGSLGAIYSTITGNTIHDVHVRQLFGGCEQAGIKIHGAIDVEIRGNRIYRAYRGMWMDWMGQGTRITGNLCYDNSAEDLYMEVNHGPYLVDNNMFLSQRSLWDMSEGGAFVHNLMTGKIDNWYDMSRFTPFLKPHATDVAGLVMTHGGDNRFFNNIFLGLGVPGAVADKNVKPQESVTGYGLWVYDVRESPPQTGGNMYGNGARPHKTETNWAMQTGDGARATLVTEGDQVFLHLTLGLKVAKEKSVLVTTALLGKAKASDCAYENPDGTPLRVSTDYFGKSRSASHPTPGPFEAPGTGTLTMKVWPLASTRKTK